MLDHFRKLNNQPAGQGGTEAAIRIGNSATEIAEELGVNPQAIRQANDRIHRRQRLVLQDLIE